MSLALQRILPQRTQMHVHDQFSQCVLGCPTKEMQAEMYNKRSHLRRICGMFVCVREKDQK